MQSASMCQSVEMAWGHICALSLEKAERKEVPDKARKVKQENCVGGNGSFHCEQATVDLWVAG